MKTKRKPGRPTQVQALVAQLTAHARKQAEAEVLRELQRAFRVALRKVGA